jgi:hypothetical protein
VLGVEANKYDGGPHDFHWVDTNTVNSTSDVAGTTTADTLQISFNGSNTGLSGMVGTRKSVLIGPNISGGSGATTFGYRAKSVPFEYIGIAPIIWVIREIIALYAGATTITPGVAFFGYTFNFFGTPLAVACVLI